MKILQIVHGFIPYMIAGTEVYSYNLSKELAKRHEVFIFFRNNNYKSEEYSLSFRQFEGMQLYSINNTFKLLHSFENTYSNDKIDKAFAVVLDKIKPDVVHIQHLMFLSTGIIKEIRKRNIPIVFTLHDYWLICPQGQLLKNNSAPCEGKDYSCCLDCVTYQLYVQKNTFKYHHFLEKILPNAFLQLFRKIYINYAKVLFLPDKMALEQIKNRVRHMQGVFAEVDIFISPSKFLREKFIKFGIPEKKIIFSRYGFDFNSFKEINKKHSSKLRFAFIGNFMPAKGLHLLVEAFNRINPADAELKIYGKLISYKGLIENYFHKTKKLVKNKNIHFFPHFDNRNAAEIFSEIDVLVAPSIWYENSPLVIQEAFLTGTAVIAADIGGISELIRNGLNGLLFKNGDIDSLKSAIEYIIFHPDCISKFRVNATPVKNIEDNSVEIEKIYNKLIRDKNAI